MSRLKTVLSPLWANGPLGQGALAVVVAALTLLLGVLLGGGTPALEAFGLLAACVMVSAVVAALVTAALLAGRLNHLVGLVDFKEIVDRHASLLASSRLVTHEQLAVIESEFRTDEIWILTARPQRDAEGSRGSFHSIVERNIKRGVKYLYIVPETVGRAAENALVGPLPPDGVSVERIAADSWQTLPMSDQVLIVYNPHARASFDNCVAYFEFPAEGEEPCWGRVNPTLAAEWSDRISGTLVQTTDPAEDGKIAADQ